MSWEVGPAGLSTMSRPSIDCLLDLLEKYLLELVDWPVHRTASRVLVSPAAEFLCNRPDVDVALRPHAHAVIVALGLLEKDHRLDLLHRERKVDQPFGILVGAASLARH